MKQEFIQKSKSTFYNGNTELEIMQTYCFNLSNLISNLHLSKITRKKELENELKRVRNYLTKQI